MQLDANHREKAREKFREYLERVFVELVARDNASTKEFIDAHTFYRVSNK